MSLVHALSIDVEDWFQVLNMRDAISRDDWDDLELRCGDSTRRILELLEKHGARATFFFLGWIAERLPDLVLEVQKAGHEIGSHGYDHRLLDQFDAAGFDEDLARTELILEGITGERPRSFRACTWSIMRDTRWALPTLVSRGYTLDSSIFPVAHPDYGVPGAPSDPYRLKLSNGELIEFPPLTLGFLGRRLPVGGGGYLRLFPLSLLKRALRKQEAKGLPGLVYFHPWEMDPDQPRKKLGGMRGFRHYVNLRSMARKLDRLLAEFQFAGLEASLRDSASCADRLPAIAEGELFG